MVRQKKAKVEMGAINRGKIPPKWFCRRRNYKTEMMGFLSKVQAVRRLRTIDPCIDFPARKRRESPFSNYRLGLMTTKVELINETLCFSLSILRKRFVCPTRRLVLIESTLFSAFLCFQNGGNSNIG